MVLGVWWLTKEKDLEAQADAEIDDMRRRMTDAAKADNEGRERGLPATNKLKLLPEVVALLNRNNLQNNLVDPDINLLQAVRFFLEPLNDGSLPAYNIQRELFATLAKLPITKDSLVASGIGKVIHFYTKSKRPEPAIKTQAERLMAEWTRPILKRTDDYRKKEVTEATYDPSYVSCNPCSKAVLIQDLQTSSRSYCCQGINATASRRRCTCQGSRNTRLVRPRASTDTDAQLHDCAQEPAYRQHPISQASWTVGGGAALEAWPLWWWSPWLRVRVSKSHGTSYASQFAFETDF